MKKQKAALQAICAFLCFCLLAFPSIAYADSSSGNIQITQLDSATKNPVAGISLTLYKIADYTGENLSGFSATDDFQDLDIDFDDLGETDVSEQTVPKLESYIDEQKINGLATLITDNSGVVNFTDLSDGIYLIRQTNTDADFETLGYTYQTDSYLVSLPRTDEDGTQTRTVICNPKGELKTEEETVDVSVYKVWNDSNNKYGKRPGKIKVGLYNGSTLVEEVSLSAIDNWSYSWSELDPSVEWQVKEMEVPNGYSSSVVKEDNKFTITNTYKPSQATVTPSSGSSITKSTTTKTTSSPKTGDSTNIMLYILFNAAAIVWICFMLKGRKRNPR